MMIDGTAAFIARSTPRISLLSHHPSPIIHSTLSMSWNRFKTHLCHNADLGVTLDISRMPFPDDFFSMMEPRMQGAFAAMTKLEGGAIANPDEKRMVGHYWLRAPQLAPSPDITGEITQTLNAVKDFTAKVHAGT